MPKGTGRELAALLPSMASRHECLHALHNNSADNLQVGNRNNNNPYNENNNWEPDADVPRVAMDGHNGAAIGFRLASLFSPARMHSQNRLVSRRLGGVYGVSPRLLVPQGNAGGVVF